MPHVIVKMYAGKTDEEKTKLASEITKAFNVCGWADGAVSVAVEDFEKNDWPEKVYRPDILDKSDALYKKPGYNPFA
jgi:4-oxalocrotonate tautomerase